MDDADPRLEGCADTLYDQLRGQAATAVIPNPVTQSSAHPPPEEIFGPLSISELKQDRFRRNTAGYLPSVRVAFLDEIFKASSSILNALLTILNERTYHNGAEALDVPLQALIAASNELPTGQEELEALYDRFLVRSFVDYVSADSLPRLLDKPAAMAVLQPFTPADLATLRQASEAVTLPADIVSAIQRIWAAHKQTFKEDRRENLSDRRLKKAVGLLCISAASNDRKEVDLSDLLLLKDCLWNHPDNAIKVRDLVMNTLRGFSRPVSLNELATKADRNDAPHQASSAVPHKKAADTRAIIKGCKGSGTEHDPILIEDPSDFINLERKEVGLQGYWFRQTADINFSGWTTWPEIEFQGHYDGGGHTLVCEDDQEHVFARIKKSNLANLRLNGLNLAGEASDCQIAHCASGEGLLGTANNCQIVACQTGKYLVCEDAIACEIKHCCSSKSLVGGEASKTLISNCQSGSTLIAGGADACTIQDCLVQIDSFPRSLHMSLLRQFALGNAGVAGELTHGSIVERCFVTIPPGSDGTLEFSGVTSSCSSSSIRQCALGAINAPHSIKKRIAGKAQNDSRLENNVALDSNKGESNPNGEGGKSLSAAQFTQRYFENHLNWDFKTVWQWSDERKEPELRAVGVGAIPFGQRHTEPVGEMDDLLTLQVKANLWL